MKNNELFSLNMYNPHASILFGGNTWVFFSELRFTGNNQLIKQTKKEMRF